jgi:hypothetical protein
MSLIRRVRPATGVASRAPSFCIYGGCRIERFAFVNRVRGPGWSHDGSPPGRPGPAAIRVLTGSTGNRQHR